MNKTNKNPYQQRMRILNEATNANKDEVTIFLLLSMGVIIINVRTKPFRKEKNENE